MIRKKLIALGLVGMTVIGVTATNTKVAKAYTNYNISVNNNINIKELIKETSELLKKVKDAVHNEDRELAKVLMSDLDYHMRKLNGLGEITEEIRHDYSVIRTEYLVLMDDRETTIKNLKNRIEDSLRDLDNCLKIKDYTYFENGLKYINDRIKDLAKYEPVNKAIINKFNELKDRYANRGNIELQEKLNKTISNYLDKVDNFLDNGMLDNAKKLLNNVDFKIKNAASNFKISDELQERFNNASKRYHNLDNHNEDLNRVERTKEEILLNLNKINEYLNEEKFDEAGKLIDEVDSKIDALSKETTVPVAISNEFKYTVNRFQDLIFRKDMANRLRHEIISILNDIENALNEKNYDDNVDGRLRYISSRIDQLGYFGPVDEDIINKFNVLNQRFVNRDKVEPVHPVVDPIEPKEENKEIEKVDAIDLIEIDKNKDDKKPTEDKKVQEKENSKKEDVQAEKVLVEKVIIEKKEIAEKKTQLPKTGNAVGAEMILGLGAAISALGALTLKKFRK